MPNDGALQFAERVIALVDTGRKTATYKLATLLALIDVASEHVSTSSSAPVELHGREVARRVVELYWPQTVVYRTDSASVGQALRQSSQNDIPAKLAEWRRSHSLGLGATIGDAEQADPTEWARLESQLIATVIGMPLSKLQRFGDGITVVEERIIYDFSWPDEVTESVINEPGFDDTINLRPGVGAWLIQLAPLLRPLVQAKWAQLVARRNSDVVDAHQLDEFLFGATRISLDRVRQPLTEFQGGQCFYCAARMQSVAVDHFLPWSRHPDNTLDNLVSAHPACNGAKSTSIAGQRHLDAWCQRSNDARFQGIADATGWPRRRERTIGAVNATYLWLPERTRLWVRGQDYEQLDRAGIQASLRTLDPVV